MSEIKVDSVLVFNALLGHLPEARKRIVASIGSDLGRLHEDAKVVNEYAFINAQKSINERLQACIDSYKLEQTLVSDPRPKIILTGQFT